MVGNHSDSSTGARIDRRTFLRGSVAAGVTALGVGGVGTAAAFSGDDGDITGPADFPRATTRDHFDITWYDDVYLTDGHTASDYDTVGSIPGWNGADPAEVVISVHGWLTSADAAPDHFATVSHSLSRNGHDAPVVGFSYDADTGMTNWWPAVEIAKRNGTKLANFLTDYAARSPGTTFRIIGHSLGAAVTVETITSLNNWGYRDLLASGTLLGGAVDNDAVSTGGEYGDDIGSAVGQFDNFWKDGDDVLNWAYTTAEFDSAVGEEGCEGTEPWNYTDHNVNYVPDHFSYYEPGDGCMPDVVAAW